MEVNYLKNQNCYEYRFLNEDELKKIYDYLEKWKKSNKISRKDLSMYFNPEKCDIYGFLRVVGEKHYYRVYLDKENFLKVAQIVKKGWYKC